MNITLQSVINRRVYSEKKGWHTKKRTLTDKDREQIVEVIGGNAETRLSVRRFLAKVNAGLQGISFWGFDRICLDRGKWNYFAGQDHTSEIRSIRKYILSINQ